MTLLPLSQVEPIGELPDKERSDFVISVIVTIPFCVSVTISISVMSPEHMEVLLLVIVNFGCGRILITTNSLTGARGHVGVVTWNS